MELIYKSTRNSNETATASMAILKGLANEGGLFVPDEIPAFDTSLEELAKMDYREVAYNVMKLMLTDFTEEELNDDFIYFTTRKNSMGESKNIFAWVGGRSQP